ncbi:hypothetical protein APR11_005499, partial [Nocardia amikacinitolerans]|nr:hypothetical protein [Nocardia amikacinitolerans]
MAVGRTVRALALAGAVTGFALFGSVAAIAQPGGIPLEEPAQPSIPGSGLPLVPMTPEPAAAEIGSSGAGSIVGTGSAGLGSAGA